MVLETTYNNKETTKTINAMVGRPFSFLQAIKMKGIGSKRMIIDEVSPSLSKYLNTVSDLTYGSIELRPNGILVSMNKGLRNFVWVIPYYQFYMYKTNGVSIHAQGKFVHFKNNRTHKENRIFFQKLVKMKTDYDHRYPHVDTV
ncbi:hypothetical protein J8281_09280 [Aquimarina sp. U1-2]|uniref:hypothetical protein n=1 Tax=Aquimarina sp. U1-2 TaxID=2823141 RepID=UPI001AECFF5B|nr:hypothetical protein [Aquimarina sp. U1-2]MBP2832376.1 hypothetical protein [Aquimarina sp. U1-2]